MPPEEAEKFRRAQAKATGQPVEAAPAEPTEAPAEEAPEEPEAEAPPAQPGQPTPEQMQAQMEQIQRTIQLTQPYMGALTHMLAAKDPLVYDILSEISSATAQLVRILSDYHRRAGAVQLAVIPFAPPQPMADGNVDWNFVKIAMMLLSNPIVEQYVHTPGPQYWMNYLNQGSILDLAARQEKLAELQQSGALPQQPSPTRPRSYRPGS